MVWYNIIFGRKKQKTNTLPNIRCRTKGDCIREYHGQHCITYDQYYSCEPKMEMASVVFFFSPKKQLVGFGLQNGKKIGAETEWVFG